MQKWATSQPGKILLPGILCVLLQQFSITYWLEFDNQLDKASLIHLQTGALMAIAMLERDPRIFIGIYAFPVVSWLFRSIASSYPPHLAALGVLISLLSGFWIFYCARKMGWPKQENQLTQQDLLRFILYGLLILPAGFGLLTFFYALTVSPQAALNSTVQILFAKYFGVLILTLPIVLAWTERKRPPLITPSHRWITLSILVTGLLLSMQLGMYIRKHIPDIGNPAIVLGDYRIAALAIVGWCMLTLRPLVSLPLLTLLMLGMVFSLGKTAEMANTALGFFNLIQLALEIGIVLMTMLYLFIISRDRVDLTERLGDQTRRDSLTGLPNLRALRQAPVSENHELACLLLDQTDKLPIGYGLKARAIILQEVAEYIAPYGVQVFFLGDGQFALLGQKNHSHQWTKLLQGIEQHPFQVADVSVRLLPYLGISVISHDTDLEEALLQASNLAFSARANNEVAPLYAGVTPGNLQQARSHLRDASQILSHLRRQGGLSLYFQPIIPLQPGNRSNGKINGEVLCRLHDSQGNLLSPFSFMWAIELMRRGPELDMAVTQTLFMQLRQQPHLISHCERISINLTGQSLASTGFHQRFLALLETAPLPLSSLCIEITETMAIFGAKQARQFLEKLRTKGCKIAIDDFGIGMQSFARLKEMPVDIIKIDGSFVRNIVTDPRDYAIVQASIAIAKAWHAQVVAEYVESAEIEVCLQQLGAEWGQGYLYAKPMPLLEGMHRMQHQSFTP